jgi:hypothetical protein
VPIDRQQRALVYSVSPSARVLEPVLEAPDNGWKRWECPHYGPCDDYPGGGEPWAFRDAAAATGWFDNEAEFQRLFGRIADDVERACASRRLRCSRALPPSVQLVQRAQIRPVMSKAVRRFAVLVGPFAADPSLSVDALYEVPDWQRRELRRGVLLGLPTSQRSAERQARDAARSVPVRVLRLVYGWLLVPLLLATTAALALLGWRDRRLRPVAVFGLALAAGVAARLVVFAVVETTQYWIANHARYDLPARAFLVAFAAVGLGLIPDAWSQWSGRGAYAGDRLETQGEAHHH